VTTEPAARIAVGDEATRAVTAPPPHEQRRARYPDRTGFVERDGVRSFYEVYGKANYTFNDYNFQRKNLVNHCTGTSRDPKYRDSWGVDVNRNYSVGSYFDGYVGGSPNCLSGTYAGTGELSESESRNVIALAAAHPNIKFAMNVHSYGGYFMWPPGAYKADGRITLPRPSIDESKFFLDSARRIVGAIQASRGTVTWPSYTGPVADVLYSAAGNSADEAYYNHGIIGYDFEIGADRFTGTGTAQTEVGFTPPYNDEGHAEGMEFAHGNYALLDSALDYARDTKAPTVTAVGPDISSSSFDVTFSQDEAAEIHYTTDGSAPTMDSPLYGPSHPRGRPDPVRIAGTTTLRWIARDFKGNTSTGSRLFQVGGNGGVGGDVPATLSLTLGAPPSFGAFTPGVDRDYTAGTTATVTSTAGDALLSVADPDTAHPGHLVNGQYFLPSPLQMRGRKSDAQGTAFNNVGSLLNLLTWSAPVSNDAVSLDYKQHISANDGLWTGNYAKTLTFTLSTTNP